MDLGVFYMMSVLKKAGVLLKSASAMNRSGDIRVGPDRRKFEKSSENGLTRRRNVL